MHRLNAGEELKEGEQVWNRGDGDWVVADEERDQVATEWMLLDMADALKASRFPGLLGVKAPRYVKDSDKFEMVLDMLRPDGVGVDVQIAVSVVRLTPQERGQ